MVGRGMEGEVEREGGRGREGEGWRERDGGRGREGEGGRVKVELDPLSVPHASML